MTNKDILLLHPPGWSLNTGGPHIGLPLIKGYLNTKKIPCHIRDLNVEAASFYSVSINENLFPNYTNEFNENKADNIYTSTQEKLNRAAKQYDGYWNIANGFNFIGCNLKSSEDIRVYSQKESPFTEFYKIKLISKLNNCSLSIIGIGATIPSQLLSAFELARLIKSSGYNGKLVLGGNVVTRLQQDILKDWVFDIFDGIVFFQGEEALEHLWYAEASKISYSEIPNFAWKSGNSIKVNKIRQTDKHSFALPDFNGYPLEKYWGSNFLTAVQARGCYYGKCEFCAIPYAWGKNGFAGFDRVDNVVNYLKLSTEKWGVNKFSFVDESMHPEYFKRIASQLNELKIEIKYEGYARFDNQWSDPEFLSTVSKSGLRKVYMGLELIDGNCRTALHKNDKASNALETLKRLYDAGIRVHLFCMFGYPGTNEEEAINTIDFLLQNDKFIDTVDISPFVYERHTNVNGVVPIKYSESDWAIHYEYNPINKDFLNSDESRYLAESLEKVIAQEKPQWLHPVYRLFDQWE